MAEHPLPGGGTINVLNVSGRFLPEVSKVEYFHQFKTLKFSRPKEPMRGVRISFKYKVSGAPTGMKFGIKQYVSVDWYNVSMKGNKSIDGSIIQTYKAPERWMIDVSSDVLS